MKVLYDYQAFLQHHGGVSRYFVELIRAMSSLGGFTPVMPVPYSDNEYIENKKTFLIRRHFKGKTRILGLLNQRQARRGLLGDFDIFHPTYYRLYFLDRLRTPFVVTVHDMIHELFSKTGVRDDGTAENKRVLCARAAKIIAVSLSTRNDLCRILGVPESKVKVIHHATNLKYNGQDRLHQKPYILFVGEREGYKNFDNFLSAAAPLLIRHRMDLVCAGGRAFSKAERTLFSRLGVQEKVFRVGVSSADELASLYHFARLFCYPSLYEGFGLPLLEAFACGCPVAAGSSPSFVEIAADAAERFDATSVESIAAAVERLILDSERGAKLAAAGALRLKDFSWQKSAQSTLEVYREAL